MQTLIGLMGAYQATTAYRHNDLVGLKNRNTRLYDWYRYTGQGYVQAGSTARLPQGVRREEAKLKSLIGQVQEDVVVLLRAAR